MTFSPKQGEETRWERIVELLVRLDSFTDLRAMALLALTDDAEPNPFAVLAERGLPLAYAAGTQQLFRYIERRLGMATRIDREARDYVFPQLRELGIIEAATVRSKAHAKKTGELLLRGRHDPPKTPNSAYTLTEEAKELLDTPPDQWEAALDEFVRGDEKRRVRVQQQIASKHVASAPSTAAGKHSALIHATVNALRASVASDAELVYVDDADGPRLRDYEQRLTDLGLTLDLRSRYPDAILADTAQRVVWFVDAVTSDGEIDEVRRQELGRWAQDRGYGVAGYVTAYETWRKMANRQGRMKNLAVDSFVWVAEDGGKLFSVRPLG